MSEGGGRDDAAAEIVRRKLGPWSAYDGALLAVGIFATPATSPARARVGVPSWGLDCEVTTAWWQDASWAVPKTR